MNIEVVTNYIESAHQELKKLLVAAQQAGDEHLEDKLGDAMIDLENALSEISFSQR